MKYFFIIPFLAALSGISEESDFTKIIERLKKDDFEIRQEAQNEIRQYSQSRRWELMRVLATSKDLELQAAASMIDGTFPVPYELYRGDLQSGNAGDSALLTSAEMRDAYIRSENCSNELTASLAKVDFSKQCVLIYNFCHSGSRMDISALKTSYKDGAIVCETYDAEKRALRTCHLKTSTHYFVLTIDRSRVNRVNVIDGMGETRGREYFIDLKGATETERAAQSIQGFADYRDWPKEKILRAEELNFSNYDLSEADYRHLRLLPKLRKISLRNSNVTAGKLNLLKDHPLLNAFSFGDRLSVSGGHSSVIDDCLVALPPSIEFLDVSSAEISVAGLASLKNFQHLKTLRMRYITTDRASGSGKKITPEGLYAVSEVSSLRDLDLSGVTIPPDLIGKLESLRSLRIELNGKNVDQGIANLEKLSNLTHLDIECSELANKHLKTIGTLKNLTCLNIDRQNLITDDGLALLAPLKNISELSLGYAKIGDEGLKHLLHLPIRRLDLRSTKITDKSLEAIADHFEMIEELNLRYAQKVTQGGAAAIQRMKKLRYLNARLSFEGLSEKDQENVFKGMVLYDDDNGLRGER